MTKVTFEVWVPEIGDVLVDADVLRSEEVFVTKLTSAADRKDMLDVPMSGASRVLIRKAAVDTAEELWGDGQSDRAAEEAGDAERESA